MKYMERKRNHDYHGDDGDDDNNKHIYKMSWVENARWKWNASCKVSVWMNKVVWMTRIER